MHIPSILNKGMELADERRKNACRAWRQLAQALGFESLLKGAGVISEMAEMPPPAGPVVNSAATQTPPQCTVSTQDGPPLEPPVQAYAEVAIQKSVPPPPDPASLSQKKHRKSRKWKGKAAEHHCGPGNAKSVGGYWECHCGPARCATPPPQATLSTSETLSPQARTLVTHAAPLKYRPGTMRKWIEEDNKGVNILGVRWLLKEGRRGVAASSLVIYMKDLIEVAPLRMGRRLFCTTYHDWNR